MPRHSRPMPVEAFAIAALTMDDGKNERKRIGSRTATDALVVFCRALRARPRLQIREAHIYRRNPGPSGEDAAFSGQPRDVGSNCPAPERCGSAVIGASNLSSS